MHANRLIACLGVFAGMLGALVAAPEAEQNAWPFLVRERNTAGQIIQWNAAGPFLFDQPGPDDTRISGLRPLWYEQHDSQGRFRAGFFLYPIFSYRQDESTYQWNIFELIRRTNRRAGAAAPTSQFEPRGDFEVWPFIFSRETGDPALSYHAFFPIGGTVKNKLGVDRATFVLFPLYLQTEKKAVVTTDVPWPFIRITSGAAHGFGIWPLFEWKERPGVWRQETYLWPLGYNNTTYPAADAPAGTPPTRDIGALPLYARRTAPGYVDESYLWPFFGYTDRTQPVRFHETRYFWPFFVQARGDQRYTNRWGPFYTHSNVKGYDKTWYAWPVVRRAEWQDRGLDITKTQVLYFLYWSERERRAAQPNTKAAYVTHVWPLFSVWNNGVGAEQFQLFSPLEVFFPGNEKIRAAWSPLFAIARYEQTAPGQSRISLLWHAVTWQRNEAAQAREFHVGPLFSVSQQAENRRIAIGNGLISFQRTAGSGWRIGWFDFHSRNSNAAPATR